MEETFCCYTKMVKGVILEQFIYKDGDLIAYHCCPTEFHVGQHDDLVTEHKICSVTLDKILTYRLSSGRKIVHKVIVDQIGKL